MWILIPKISDCRDILPDALIFIIFPDVEIVPIPVPPMNYDRADDIRMGFG
jgi:hypothetical protein